MKIFLLLICFVSVIHTTTLKEIYDTALPEGEFDKVLKLEKGKVYKGGLSIGMFYNPFTGTYDSLDYSSIKIEGNGSILDLQRGEIHIAYKKNRMDIDSCAIINGKIRYNGFPGEYPNNDYSNSIPYGNVKNVTLYSPVDYGIRFEGAGIDSYINKCLVVDCISTGGGFEQYGSFPSEIIRTGTSYAFSIFDWYGVPDLIDNWSYNRLYPDEPLNHFSMLCEYG